MKKLIQDILVLSFVLFICFILIYLVNKSNIIMGNFSENNYAILVIAFVAGFNHEWVVEYLIKTILSKVGKKNNEKEDKKEEHK